MAASQLRSSRRVRIAMIFAILAVVLVTLKITVGSEQWVCEHITGGQWVKNDVGLGNGDAYGVPAMVAGAPDYSCTKS